MLHRRTSYIGLLLVVAVAMAAGFGLGYSCNENPERIDGNAAVQDGNTPFTLVPVLMPRNIFAGEVWEAETLDAAMAEACLNRPIEIKEGMYSFATLTRAIAQASNIDVIWNPRLIADESLTHEELFGVYGHESLPVDEGRILRRIASKTTLGESVRVLASMATELGVPTEGVPRISPGMCDVNVEDESRSIPTNVVTVVIANNAVLLVRMSIVEN